MTTSTTSDVTASSKRKRSNTPDNLGDSLQLQSSEQVHSEEDDDEPEVHPKKKEKRQDDAESGASPTSTDRLPPISRSWNFYCSFAAVQWSLTIVHDLAFVTLALGGAHWHAEESMQTVVIL